MHTRIVCPEYEFGMITPNIAVGPLPPVGDVLCRHFTDVVLCSESYQPRRECFDDMKVHNCPLRDDLIPFTGPHEKMIFETVLSCVDSLRKGGKILFTCHSGFNRSALLACLTARQLGYNIPDFINRIRYTRGHSALSNPMFVQYIHERM